MSDEQKNEVLKEKKQKEAERKKAKRGWKKSIISYEKETWKQTM